MSSKQGIGVEKTKILSDDLVNEAKKYKTFEEFKKSQWKELYHWTNANFEEFDKNKMWMWNFWKWFYFTDNKNIADNFWKNTKIVSIKMNKPFYAKWLLKWKSFLTEIYDNFPEIKRWELINTSEFLKSKWYDWVIFKSKASWNEFMVFDKNQIKTEAQLKKIWEQAKK